MLLLSRHPAPTQAVAMCNTCIRHNEGTSHAPRRCKCCSAAACKGMSELKTQPRPRAMSQALLHTRLLSSTVQTDVRPQSSPCRALFQAISQAQYLGTVHAQKLHTGSTPLRPRVQHRQGSEGGTAAPAVPCCRQTTTLSQTQAQPKGQSILHSCSLASRASMSCPLSVHTRGGFAGKPSCLPPLQDRHAGPQRQHQQSTPKELKAAHTTYSAAGKETGRRGPHLRQLG